MLNSNNGHINFMYLPKYLNKSNPTPQHKLAYICFQKSDMLAYLPLVLIYRDGNLQLRCQKVYARYFLVHFHFSYGL